ncbi:hypothetical protein OIV83_001506 [Microbotryomycetes sp. JL201]|nr:hypothetical protein OIV83_001506 [Microbotryomycetes sp. JL201]
MPATTDELRHQLAELQLDTRGHKDVLKRRLLNARKAQQQTKDSDGGEDGDQDAPSAMQRPLGERFDSFLVLDVEATCVDIKDARLAFSYPNEIIEWPVLLLQWRGPTKPDEQSSEQRGNDDWSLHVVDEYHSYVRPRWQPQLDRFCTDLTGITQHKVDSAPTFPTLLRNFKRDFIDKHGLFTDNNRTAWVTDGPWDLESFVAKALYINEIDRPKWLAGDMVDLRILVASYFGMEQKKKPVRGSNNGWNMAKQESPTVPDPPPATDEDDQELLVTIVDGISAPSSSADIATHAAVNEASIPPRARQPPGKPPATLSLLDVLDALDLGPFQGRLHCGLDDARNASRILQDLQRRGVALSSNRIISTRERRWGWMRSGGKVVWNPEAELARRRDYNGGDTARRG